ncbi:MAG: hypothetical protein FJ029_13995, partial [Actinobacteria bacterium]|nr:hypothetical protein [Actinomycetota bacterium]
MTVRASVGAKLAGSYAIIVSVLVLVASLAAVSMWRTADDLEARTRAADAQDTAQDDLAVTAA